MYYKISLAVCCLILSGMSLSAQGDPIDYPGQTVPGYYPEEFDPDNFTSEDLKVGPVFSPDGKEMYYTGTNGDLKVIMYRVYSEGSWSEPEIAPFSGFADNFNEANPCFSPSGNTIFYSSDKEDPSEYSNIWYVERNADGWETPVMMGDSINNADSNEDQPFITSDSSMFFVSDRSGQQDIYYSSVQDNYHRSAIAPEDHVNSDEEESYPVLSDSMLLFVRNGDVYVCYRNEDTLWSDAEMLSSNYNTDSTESGLRFSPDKKYFFFSRNGSAGNSRTYWVDAEALDYLGARQAPFNYITSWYAGIEEQMELALHPELAKRQVTSATTVSEVSYNWMLNAVNSCTGCISNLKTGRKDIEILHQTGNMALAKAKSEAYIDYLHLVKFGNQWKILNAIWDYHSATEEGSASEAEQTVMDYVDSWQEGNGTIMSEVLHPKFTGRMAVSLSGAEQINYAQLVSETENCAGCTAGIEKKILIPDVALNMACAVIINGDSVEYLHLSFVGGQYQVVHSLRNYPLDHVSALTQNSLKKIRLYPNPATDDITLSIAGKNDNRYIIYNSQGMVMKTGISKNRTIQISSLKPGIYFVSVENSSRVCVGKFVKN